MAIYDTLISSRPCVQQYGFGDLVILKPDTISFGQAMPERETAEAVRRSEECDLFIVIGSSLVVHPAASMPLVAKERGAKLVISIVTRPLKILWRMRWFEVLPEPLCHRSFKGLGKGKCRVGALSFIRRFEDTV